MFKRLKGLKRVTPGERQAGRRRRSDGCGLGVAFDAFACAVGRSEKLLHRFKGFNVGCLIVITPLPPKFYFFEFFFWGGQPSYNNFWESYSWDHGSGGRGGGGNGGGRGGGGGEEGEGEGGQQNWSCGKKFPLLPCLVQVCYCYSGACKGGTLCGPVFLLFLIRVL